MSNPPLLDASKPIAAKLLPGQWFGVIGAILVGSGMIYTTLFKMDQSVAEARRQAASAEQMAEKALDQASSMKTQLDSTLMQLSAKLGRIEGLLEAMQMKTQ